MTINAGVKAAGVVWHDCTTCGRSWPFPMGIPPWVNERTHENREWACHVCVNAAARPVVRLHAFLAAWTTTHNRERALLKRYLDNHCANADAEGMSALCECKLCLETRVALQ